MSAPTICASCGVPFTEHRGIIATCAELQLRKRAADRLARAVARLVQIGKLDARSEASDALLDYLGVGSLEGPGSVPEWCDQYDQGAKR